jgi:hypothetical protein
VQNHMKLGLQFPCPRVEEVQGVSRLIKLNGDSDYVEPEAAKVISER